MSKGNNNFSALGHSAFAAGSTLKADFNYYDDLAKQVEINANSQLQHFESPLMSQNDLIEDARYAGKFTTEKVENHKYKMVTDRMDSGRLPNSKNMQDIINREEVSGEYVPTRKINKLSSNYID